jgi:hypothetical protein
VRLCYVDESGKGDILTTADRDQQPVVVIAGIDIPEASLTELTHEWMDIKARYYPSSTKDGGRKLDAILQEVKGSKIRKGFTSKATGRQRKHAIGLIDQTLRLLEQHDGSIMGRVWVKALGVDNDDMRMHSSSLQFICSAFHSQIPDDERGVVIVDSQTYQHNHRLAHSMFTQRFCKDPRNTKLADMPVFGHSANHAGLQIADLLCSAVLAPIACGVYCTSYAEWNTHSRVSYLDIREHFGSRVEALTFKFRNQHRGRNSSSVVVNDRVSQKPSRLMWGPVGSRRATDAEFASVVAAESGDAVTSGATIAVIKDAAAPAE